MIVIRWTTSLIFLLCLALFISGARSWELVVFACVMFAIAGWAWGAATPGPWTTDGDDSHPETLGSLDLLQMHGSQTTAGGEPPTRAPTTAPPAVSSHH